MGEAQDRCASQGRRLAVLRWPISREMHGSCPGKDLLRNEVRTVKAELVGALKITSPVLNGRKFTRI